MSQYDRLDFSLAPHVLQIPPLQSERPLRIRLVNRVDLFGGAECVVQDQLHGFLACGHDAQLFVGEKRGTDAAVFEISVNTTATQSARINLWVSALTDADVIHFHNLHGRYVDLEVIRELSRTKTVILTMHDQFLYTGGCVHVHGCRQWTSGCWQCPQLATLPEGTKTADQWNRKRHIWSSSRVHIVAPARWIFERAQASILNSDETIIHHIPNGVNTHLFTPRLRHAVKCRSEAFDNQIVLFTVAHNIRSNRSKDWGLLLSAIRWVAETVRIPVMLLVAGDSGEDITSSSVRIRFLGQILDRAEMARYYSLSDIYIHASRAETFSLAILEAMACGCAIVATDVGGVVEQLNPAGVDTPRRGLVTNVGDFVGLGNAILHLIHSPELRSELSQSASSHVIKEWSLDRHIESHLTLYRYGMLRTLEIPFPRLKS
jgi:glycosyltransferase involved in cell wall biosynthesis